MKYCIKCGATLSDENQFCPSCGTKQPEKNELVEGFEPEEGQQSEQATYERQGEQNPQSHDAGSSEQSQKGLAVVAYILGWIGFIIALLAGDRSDPFFEFHLNQALVLHIFALIGMIPYVGWVWDIVMVVFYIMGIIYAWQGEMKQVPLFGGIKILK